MFDTKTIITEVEAAEQSMIALRRALHEHPELGGFEDFTSGLAQEEMKKLGLPIAMITKHAFAATLDTGHPGKTVMLRADMDALKIQEDKNNLKEPKVAVSKIDGMCHACGHDAHTSNLIHCARILTKHKDELMGKIVFLFESGEENNASALAICDYLENNKPDVLFGLHVGSDEEFGHLTVSDGVRSSGVALITPTFVGVEGHSSRPDLSVNPIVPAAAAYTELTCAIPLMADPAHINILSMCLVQGGHAFNIIPRTITMSGALRFFDPKDGEYIVPTARAMCENTAKAYGCTVEWPDIPMFMYMPIINDPAVCDVARAACDKVLPGFRKEMPGMAGSESFGRYSMIVPACFSWVGAGNAEKGMNAAHHNKNFDIDERCLAVCAKLTLQFTAEYCAKQ